MDLSSQPSQKSILIVDDDSDIRDILAEVLQHEGYNVLKARNGEEGLKFLESNAPSLILLDLMMPVMDGWTFKEIIDSQAATSKIPVVVLSASGKSDPAQRLGSHQRLSKPINIDTLIDVVKKTCEGISAATH